jgi:hypothetical protein
LDLKGGGRMDGRGGGFCFHAVTELTTPSIMMDDTVLFWNISLSDLTFFDVAETSVERVKNLKVV